MSGPSQLRLFAPPRPLQERFGVDFFRAIPKCPGVYLMHDGAGKILYVGKAKNLRNRIGSYRYLRAERASRKSIRLVHAVEQIRWELCDSDVAAQLRENFLLRTHRPKFNRLNVFPKAYCFIGTRAGNGRLELCFTREESEEYQLFGSFKPGASIAYHALLRLLHSLTMERFSLTEFPNGLLSSTAPKRFVFEKEFPGELIENVNAFLHGENSELLTQFEVQRARWTNLSLFENQLLESDREILSDFFRNVTRRNRSLKERFGVKGTLIPQEMLNDLLVHDRATKSA